MKEEGDEKAVFGDVSNGFGDVKSSGWDVSSKPWDLKEDEEDGKVVFDTSGEMPVSFDNSLVNEEEERAKKELFEKEEKELTEVIKGQSPQLCYLLLKKVSTFGIGLK